MCTSTGLLWSILTHERGDGLEGGHVSIVWEGELFGCSMAGNIAAVAAITTPCYKPFTCDWIKFLRVSEPARLPL